MDSIVKLIVDSFIVRLTLMAGPYQMYTRDLETASEAAIEDRNPNSVRSDSTHGAHFQI